MGWQRARSAEKKSARRDAIYAAATSLFKKHGYENVSFNGIAAEAGFTRSNMYRYFTSREEVFLSIFSELFVNWADECCSRLNRLRQDECVERFARTWVDSLMPHTHFLDLCPLLFISLEKNSSFEQLIEFKRLSKNLLGEISLEISRIYPEINNEYAFKLLSLSHAATTSYWAVSSYNAPLERIYGLEEFAMLKPNFEYELTSAIEIFIYGLKTRLGNLPSSSPTK